MSAESRACKNGKFRVITLNYGKLWDSEPIASMEKFVCHQIRVVSDGASTYLAVLETDRL